MAEDWAADVKKYVPDADDKAIAGIVRYCGIALRNRDSSLVSMSDAKETARVRDNFLKKKLGLTDPDATLDAAIKAVGERMKADRTKNRVTVYYLLSEQFGQLHTFGGTVVGGTVVGDGAVAAGAAALGAAAISAAAAPPPSAPPPPPPPPAVEPVALVVEPVPAAPVAPVIDPVVAPLAPRPLASDHAGNEDRKGGMGWLWWLLLALLLLLLIWWLFLRHPAATNTTTTTTEMSNISIPAAPSAGGVDFATAPGEGQMAIPEGAGVTSELRDGKPVVKVYFDTGKDALAPAFVPAATALNGWLSAHPGSSLAVSGYNDKTGNAAANAELSKHRAQAVAAALKTAGIADAAVALVKPADTTDTNTTNAEARRVEVVVK